MHLVNQHYNSDHTRKCLVYVDLNGHYHVKRLDAYGDYFTEVHYGREKFKHIESANRAVAKWIGKV